ncbi:MAG: alpha/beta hydrolase [Ardenticatenaceae bacterium]|nr:alpha/beta hydrolase [Anaerolineales bacterium]MCB8921755.1 alpha/beta hydrolase [Ardenticatenaceae bacterium]MCB8990726.1 alpha/beta hydrolase [Ardenticatenaceae bacterium]
MNTNNPISQTVQISSGDIEYVFVGSGPTILISHGTLGGYDQALAISQLFDYESFSFLCVSRAGYLNSSPATGFTAEDQARSYKELLDHLGIAKAAILGTSGGAPSAIRFAQDFPEQCWALLLISSILQTPDLPLMFRTAVRVQSLIMGFDPLWVITYKYGLRMLAQSNGVQATQAKMALKNPHLKKVIQGIYKPITTASLRRKGLQLDDAQIQSLPPVENYDIHVPTYISHAVNDPLAPVKDAAQLANLIPNAEYHEFSDGGHIFFVIHSKRIVPDVERFLRTHTPD